MLIMNNDITEKVNLKSENQMRSVQNVRFDSNVRTYSMLIAYTCDTRK